MLKLSYLFSSLGVNKIRLTGGEPFLRKDFVSMVGDLKKINGIGTVHITTNGVFAYNYLDKLKEIGIDSINLSLDSLDKANFFKITRRDEYDTVIKTLDGLLESNIQTKINMVVMSGKNTQEVIPMAQLTKNKKINIRFIEAMPFNGFEQHVEKSWNHKRILKELQEVFLDLAKTRSNPSNLATLYNVPEYAGNIGIVPAYTRTFCEGCNRVRLTAIGTIKNCLYDEGVPDIKNLLRSNKSDSEIKQVLIGTVLKKEKDGHTAEKNRVKITNISQSMSTISG